MTHEEEIIRFINENGEITQGDALFYFGCGRLASRIWDLKKAGYKIKKRMKKVRCKNGSYAHVAAYSWDIPIEQEIAEVKEKIEKAEYELKECYWQENEGFSVPNTELVEIRLKNLREKLEELEKEAEENE